MNSYLSFIGKKKNTAIRNYREYFKDVDVKELENPNKGLLQGFILGDRGFTK